MFNNSNIYLDRKYEKVKDMKKAVFNRNIKDNQRTKSVIVNRKIKLIREPKSLQDMVIPR